MNDLPIQKRVERFKEEAFIKKCSLSVLVEDLYDVRFWETIIISIFPKFRDKIDFPMPVRKGTRGKDVLRNFKDFVDKKFIICVDSDCQYLYDNEVWYLSEYIYHTHVYSKENFQCAANTLNEILRDLNLRNYSFDELLSNISLAISNFFYFWVYVQKKNLFHKYSNLISREQLAGILKEAIKEYEETGNEQDLTETIEQKTNEVLKPEEDEWDENIINQDFSEIQKKLEEVHDIFANETLLFCNGYEVLNELIKPLLK